MQSEEKRTRGRVETLFGKNLQRDTVLMFAMNWHLNIVTTGNDCEICDEST